MPHKPAIQIRRLIQGQGDIYRQIRLDALTNAPEAFGSSLDAEATRPPAHFEDRVVQGCVFGAFVGSKIIGMAGFYPQSGSKSAHKGVLWGMYVDPDHRNSGAGKLLVQAVIDHATGTVDLLHLSVVVGNSSAQSLYQNMGFRIYGTEPRALKIGTSYFDEAHMIRDLD